MKNKDKPLTHLDLLMWNVNHPTGLTNITAMMFFKENINAKKVTSLLDKRMAKFDKFQNKVIIKNGKPTWHADDLYDIHSHIHRIALPGNGGHEELQELISDLISTPLDYSKPLWQIHIIENYNGGSAMLWRLHHAIGDGVSLMKVLLTLTDGLKNTNKEIENAEDESETNKPKENWKEKFKHAYNLSKETLSSSGRILKDTNLVKNTFTSVAATAKDLTQFAFSSSNKNSMYKGELSVQKKVAWSNVIDLKLIKRIGKHFNATVNDTLLVALTGAIRRHMQKHAQDMEIKFNVACPVDMRFQEKGIHLGNKVGVIVLDLPVGVTEIEERFEIVAKKTKSLKKSLEPPLTYYYTQFFSDYIPKKIEEISAKFLGSKLMAILSNVPGPREPLFLADLEIDNIMFWLPHTYEMGLGFSVVSYNNKVTMGVTVDSNIVKDPETITQYFELEIKEIAENLEKITS